MEKVRGDHSLKRWGVVTKVFAAHHNICRIMIRIQSASFNKWRLGFNFHKIQQQRVKACVKESFNSVDVLNRFKLTQLQDCKVIVFC